MIHITLFCLINKGETGIQGKFVWCRSSSRSDSNHGECNMRFLYSPPSRETKTVDIFASFSASLGSEVFPRPPGRICQVYRFELEYEPIREDRTQFL